MRLVFVLSAMLACAVAQARGETIARGPMLVCFQFSTFHLAEGERIVDVGAGIHGVAIEVRGIRGAYRVAESEIFRTPKLGRRVADRNGTRVYWLKEEPLEYAITGISPDMEERVILRLGGAAFDGTARDGRIYKRFTIGDPAAQHCDYRFDYGWHLFLGDS